MRRECSFDRGSQFSCDFYDIVVDIGNYLCVEWVFLLLFLHLGLFVFLFLLCVPDHASY